MHFGGWGVEHCLVGQTSRTYRWIVGISFSSYFPFLSVLFVCMCVRVRACVCVYIYIIIYICLLVCWKIVEVGRELAPEPDFPCVFNCPTAELCCRQMILWRKGEEGNQPSQCAK